MFGRVLLHGIVLEHAFVPSWWLVGSSRHARLVPVCSLSSSGGESEGKSWAGGGIFGIKVCEVS